jgi:pyruvate dehydrogenase E1 component
MLERRRARRLPARAPHHHVPISCRRQRLRAAEEGIRQAGDRHDDGVRAPAQGPLRSKDFGNRIVPIIPDEARTFGMDAFFPTAKIYNPNGQNYTSVDRELLLAYKESPQGQIMHVGINEAGAVAAFTAHGTPTRRTASR